MSKKKATRKRSPSRGQGEAKTLHPRFHGHSTVDDLDRTPVAIPLGAGEPASMEDMIARMVRQAMQIEKAEEFETIEEAGDFEEEDPDTLDMSKYEFSEIQDWYEIPDQPQPEAFVKDDRPGEDTTGDQPDPEVQEPEIDVSQQTIAQG